MKYNSDTIATVVDKLNRTLFLPSIQREFVWKPEQVIALFDSILRGYPIGSFLFWNLKEQSRDKWQTYQFLSNVKQTGTHNEPASISDVQDPVLILDGQQRLTSLLVGLRGFYTIRKRYARWNNPDAYQKCRLYLDLLHDPRVANESEGSSADTYYRLQFRPADTPFTATEAWYPVGSILKYRSADAFIEHKFEQRRRLPGDVTIAQATTLEKNIERLHRAICAEDVIAFYVEEEQDYDRVLDIFVRANEGGTKLTKSDLLLSLVTAKWTKYDAREEIHCFVDHINNGIGADNNFDKDFVLKTSLVLADLPVGFKAQNFTDENLSTIESKWASIRDSVERTVRLVNQFGIDRDTMTSANALIPLIYFWHKRPNYDFANGTTRHERTTCDAMRRWLLSAMLLRIFGGSSDNLLRDIRAVLQSAGPADTFPIAAIGGIGRKSGPRSALMFDREQALELVQSTYYNSPMAKLILSLTLGDDSWRGRMNHVDHIVPRSEVTKRAMKEAGVPKDRIDVLYEWRDLLANLELLTPSENQEKAAKPFNQWIKSRDPSFLRTHAIPEDRELWHLSQFEQFLEAREGLLADRLVDLFRTEN